ncbi:CocE/NonD family hydrolase [Filimonas effusa]|uniref:CocE/NonD family hydrolase n=1 Tax=Filimonas effusa TaxID=2508721 RepID=A0A4V1M9G0_9BACT|nr:CocE/NonD family hydrolase [Filimonas effusa]RXK80972.1 CocE/NonD family hydrolase [Filimonas effusa]
MKKQLLLLLLACVSTTILPAQRIADQYYKIEQMIPMRDGVKLFTAIYIPRDSSQLYPFLITRTPYSCDPYGANAYPSQLGMGAAYAKEGFIFVYQDVRGRYMSEGSFREVTPAIAIKRSNKDTDESSDTYDTMEWLLKHIPRHNGRAGLYGISYPGFYATAALPNAHPSIKAVSPQAPVTDEFEGDDVNHRGAFFLMDNFSFLNYFDHPRPGPWKQYPSISDSVRIKDSYAFFLGIGPIKNLDKYYFKGKSAIWNEYLAHSTRDAYWKARDIRQHLKNIKPAVLVTGGWFDAEDLFGALKTYEAIERQNPGNNSRLIMGPWTHGAWARGNWSKFSTYEFGSNVNDYYHELEFNFFCWHLKQKGSFNQAEATVFVTGTNEWKSFSHWPPLNPREELWYLHPGHRLTTTVPDSKEAPVFSGYISDPANPVPYIGKKSGSRVNEYMAADQRFAAERPDVLYFESSNFTQPTTVCGPVTADLFVSTTGTDADFVVKIIDVLPDEKQTQQLVRAEIVRGKFRNSYERPEAFIPGQVTPLKLVLNDIAHCFLPGHKLMVQVQSSWFPLVDRNPQRFMNIPDAAESDFQASEIKIYHDTRYPSHIRLPTN